MPPSSGEDHVDMTESTGLTNVKATPLQVLVTPRLDPKFYFTTEPPQLLSISDLISQNYKDVGDIIHNYSYFI
ncbi:hypothetical protein Ddye_010404 [Dipteronia dyeriana]|uniref:Uncharacterized protein n=1 Tax=Dipteronia dyeriana TaxID=168575 RepID=A0AAD9XDL2_9ROSI|nr:hypothetical protein Ddye_010404 [Dipteronia dyeriana]